MTPGSGSKIKPYQLEPASITGYNDSEDDSSESETMVSFTEHLGYSGI